MSPRLAAKAAKLAESAAAKDVAVSGLPPAPPPTCPSGGAMTSPSASPFPLRMGSSPL